MVVLVTGSSGQVGQALQHIAPQYPDLTFYFAGSDEGDVLNKKKLAKLFLETKANYCINAAAYTAVDKAESEPEKAFAINATGAFNVAKTCYDFGASLIHISTDFVFDGEKGSPYTEDDKPNPQGVYGKTKLEGELLVQEALLEHYIVRTSWVYSQFGNNFMKTMLRLGAERPEINVVADQSGTPTHAVDLAHALLKIVTRDNEAYGTYNYSNEGIATWYDFAKHIFEVNNVEVKVNAIATSAYPTPAVRPNYSVLDKSKIKTAFELEIKPWQQSVEKIQ